MLHQYGHVITALASQQSQLGTASSTAAGVVGHVHKQSMQGLVAATYVYLQGFAGAQRKRAEPVLPGGSAAQWGQRQHHQSMGHGCPGVPQNPSWAPGRCDVHCWPKPAAPFWHPC